MVLVSRRFSLDHFFKTHSSHIVQNLRKCIVRVCKMNNPTAQNFLFFSEYCEYSHEVLGLIRQQNLSQTFNFVCVDNQRSLPQIVDRVPLIITNQNQVLVDDQIVSYLSNLYNASLDSIGALQSVSDSAFSFIEDEITNDSFAVRNFNYIDDIDMNSNRRHVDVNSYINIDTQSEKNKNYDKQYQDYMKMREEDTMRYKPPPPQ